MELREFLENRERELIEEIGSLHEQLAPKERELAEVRRAKAALGISPNAAVVFAAQGSLTVDATVRHRYGLEAAAAVAAAGAIGTPLQPAIPGAEVSARVAGESEPMVSPYATLTMKQLVRKVLSEHFPNGATTRQMLDFFRDAWGRHIERHNLSPQVSRLFQDGEIGRRNDGVWFLLNREAEPAA